MYLQVEIPIAHVAHGAGGIGGCGWHESELREAETFHECDRSGIVCENNAACLAHIAFSTFFKQFGECVCADSPALPLRIDIVGEIGDAVVSCAIVENGKRAESNNLPRSVIFYRFRDEYRVWIMMLFNPCFALFVCAWGYVGG